MAKKNNRNYIGIEISAEYVEIIKQRLQWLLRESFLKRRKNESIWFTQT
jgi:DNA modification methylase